MSDATDQPSGISLPLVGGDEVLLAGVQLHGLRQRVNRLQRTLRLAIETELGSLVGKSFGSLAANQQVAAMIHQLLDAHALRIRCPECGHPGILRCSPRPSLATGAFVIDHAIAGRRTFHLGISTIPELKLVAKPARRASKFAS